MTTTRTATRAPRATKSNAKAEPKIRTVEVELGVEGKRILDKMAEHRQVRLAAEREEKQLKEQLKAMLPTPRKKEKLVVRAAGVIRGTVSWRSRKNTDFETLLEAFPEAYEATVSTNKYTQFDPA